jgi:hypothetical protein
MLLPRRLSFDLLLARLEVPAHVCKSSDVVVKALKAFSDVFLGLLEAQWFHLKVIVTRVLGPSGPPHGWTWKEGLS